MAQEPCLDMAMLHVLVPAVLVFVGQSTACVTVEWTIANPPIIFGKTAQLLCASVTLNNSFNKNNVTSWFGGKNGSILIHNGVTADPRKYEETRTWYRNNLESILQIYKFDEMDVNVDYVCSIGYCEKRTRLSLTPDKFEYHPNKDEITILASFRNGYLDVTMDIIKVYPIPKCTIMFNENIISRGLMTKPDVSGIFYIVVEEVEHSFDVCSSQLIITCVVGKTNIPIHQETFNRCTKTKEELPENIEILRISISILVLLILIIVIGIVCFFIYGKPENFLCCKLHRVRRETASPKCAKTANTKGTTSEDNGKEAAIPLSTENKRDSTHDTGQVKIHEITPLISQTGGDNSPRTTTV